MNGYVVPDSEDYKRWRDSAPLKGEVYPPLARLIEWSDKELASLNDQRQLPPWHRKTINTVNSPLFPFPCGYGIVRAGADEQGTGHVY